MAVFLLVTHLTWPSPHLLSFANCYLNYLLTASPQPLTFDCLVICFRLRASADIYMRCFVTD